MGVPGGGIDLNPGLGLALGIFLVFLNGFFVAAEFALVKVRPTQIEPYAARGDRRGRVAKHMIEHLDAYLSATQLGITLASLALGWIGEPAFAWLLEPLLERLPNASPGLTHSISLTVAFLVITILHIVLGELAPKSVAIRKPEPTSLWIAIPLFAFYKITYPAIAVLNWAANRILSVFGIEPLSEGESAHDEEELRLLLASTQPTVLSQQKKKILDNVLTMSHRPTRKIMVPRTDVVYLSTQDPVDVNLRRAKESGHTRFPLCDGDLGQDCRTDSHQGSVSSRLGAGRPQAGAPRDRVRARDLGDRSAAPADARRAAFIWPRSWTSTAAPAASSRSKTSSKRLSGRFRTSSTAESPELVHASPNVWIAAGSLLVEDLEHALGLEFSDRDEDTIAGVVLSELGRKAQTGDRIEIGPLSVEVLEIDGNRITKVKLTVPETAPEPPT